MIINGDLWFKYIFHAKVRKHFFYIGSPVIYTNIMLTMKSLLAKPTIPGQHNVFHKRNMQILRLVWADLAARSAVYGQITSESVDAKRYSNKLDSIWKR